MSPKENTSSIRPIMAANLKKLTVLQLKALCKEKGLTGYSKLTKNAIILKLMPLYRANGQDSTIPVSGHEYSQKNGDSSKTIPPKSKSTSGTINAATEDRPERPSAHRNGSDSLDQTHIAMGNPSSITRREDGNVASASREQPPNGVLVSACVQTSGKKTPGKYVGKRALPKDTTLGNSKTKFPRVTADPTMQLVPGPGFKVPVLPERLAAKSVSSADRQVGLQKIAGVSMGQVADAIVPSTAKRFKPLIADNSNKGAVVRKGFFEESTMATPNTTETQPGALLCLDFPAEPRISLGQITLPPSIPGRKQAQKFALILSGISHIELENCSRVSKTFRYSAYLSAYHHLKRDFPGRRTESVLARYNPNVTDMWPYLLQRQREVLVRKKIYEESFLSQAVGDWYMLNERLWPSPDHPKQAAIAIRFILTRYYFIISVQGANHPDARRWHIIVDCNEVVKGEIWIISICSQDAKDQYYILEPTCEVIGCDNSTFNQPGGPQLRADWSSYIFRGDRERSLIEFLKWTNREEYEKGISKHWLERVRKEGEIGEVKAGIAQRYILACVVANSISGKWMSSIEMAQDFAGLPANGLEKWKANKDMQLYIPEHHYVESVHVISAKGRALHEALAVVQTPSREYFILRDNGMQVGSEEEGVASVWMSILGCNDDGSYNENELTRLWTLIQELSKQLNQNRSLSVSLVTQTGDIKNQSIHAQTGFVLRRFNTDKTQEEYNAELEQMNSAIVAENQSLQHDNKQLSALIKEYEQTLESIMSTFRNRARDVQERELSLVRDYETQLLALEDGNSGWELKQSTETSEWLKRMGHVLRQLMRTVGGEEESVGSGGEEEGWKSTGQGSVDCGMEREIELARLEKENEELRRMMGLLPAQLRGSGLHKRVRSPD